MDYLAGLPANLGFCAGQISDRWHMVVFSFLAACLPKSTVWNGENPDHVAIGCTVQHDDVWQHWWRMVPGLFHEEGTAGLRCPLKSHVCYCPDSSCCTGCAAFGLYQL